LTKLDTLPYGLVGVDVRIAGWDRVSCAPGWCRAWALAGAIVALSACGDAPPRSLSGTQGLKVEVSGAALNDGDGPAPGRDGGTGPVALDMSLATRELFNLRMQSLLRDFAGDNLEPVRAEGQDERCRPCPEPGFAVEYLAEWMAAQPVVTEYEAVRSSLTGDPFDDAYLRVKGSILSYEQGENFAFALIGNGDQPGAYGTVCAACLTGQDRALIATARWISYDLPAKESEWRALEFRQYAESVLLYDPFGLVSHSRATECPALPTPAEAARLWPPVCRAFALYAANSVWFFVLLTGLPGSFSNRPGGNDIGLCRSMRAASTRWPMTSIRRGAIIQSGLEWRCGAAASFDEGALQ
jgi:hypothetical protein